MPTRLSKPPDLIVDGKPYHIETLSALRELENRLLGKTGVTFPDLKATILRLQSEKAEKEAARRAELYT